MRKIGSRAVTIAGGLLVIATAAIGLAGPDLRPGVWYFLIAVGAILIAGPLAARYGHSRARRGRRRGEIETRNLVAVGALAVDAEIDDADDGFDARYPEHKDTLHVLRRAIREHCEVQFRYRREHGDDRPRVVRPRYLHERASRATGELVLCLNAYYPRRRRTLDFSVRRMHDIDLAG